MNFRNSLLSSKNTPRVCLLLLLLIISSGLKAQQQKDSIPQHSPRKATIWAAVLPGAGQIYNHKYWKVPILYAGFAGLGYAVSFNQGEYKRFGDYYKLAVDGDPNTNPDFVASPEYLRGRRNYYKRYRDLSFIGIAGLYALQILDANVDAHLMQFDLSDDLSLNWSPAMLPSYSSWQPSYPGLSFRFTFR